MKKIAISIFIALCVICVAFAFAACDEQHEMGQWIEEVAPTCTQDGVAGHYNCSHCGKNFDRDGNEIADVTLPALGHDLDEEVTKPATCTEKGTKVVSCKRGDIAEHEEEIEMIPHSYGEWFVAQGATCTEKGVSKRVCGSCGLDETEEIDKIAHTPVLYTAGKEATCTESGVTACYKCSMCGKFSATEDGDFTADSSEAVQTTIPATGHTFGDWSTFEPAQDGVAGRDIRTCSVCFHNEFRDVDALGHEYGPWEDDGNGYHHRTCTQHPDETQTEPCVYDPAVYYPATCTEGDYYVSVCSLCNHRDETEHGSPLGHAYGAWESLIDRDSVDDDMTEGHVHKHTHVCTRCNEESTRVTEECNMDGARSVEATCTTPAYTETKCTDCGSIHEEITAPANGHEISYDHKFYGSLLDCGHIATCANCDYRLEEKCRSTVVVHEATCTSDRYSEYTCTICHLGKSIPEANSALGHNLTVSFVGDFNNPQHRIKCTRQGCDYDETVACDITSTEQLPTCTQAGSISKACSVCLYSATEEGSQSVGHKWGSYSQTSVDHYRICSECHTRETNVHDFQVTKETPADCEHPLTLQETCKDCQFVRERQDGVARGHIWGQVKIYETTHEAQCATCGETASKQHDWSASNLCSVCGYDGLDYKCDGAHCTVTGDSRVTKAKNIVINEYHKELDGEGGYQTTQYRVEEVKDMVFNGQSSMETLVLPTSVKTLGKYAFCACVRLETVEFVGDEPCLTTIGDSAFQNCGALTAFEIHDTVTTIGQYAFENCTALSSLEIGDGVYDIGFKAFFNTAYVNNQEHWGGEDILYIGNHLIKVHQKQNADGSYTNSQVVIKPGTVSIAVGAFAECSNLSSVTMPSTLKVVDRDAFYNCNAIETVVFEGTFAQWMGIVFENDYSSPLHNSNVFFNISDAKDNIVIPDHVTRIPAGTFRGTSIQSVVIPASVTYIGEEAFENCAQLQTITFLGDKVNYIGKDAFKGSGYYDNAGNWTDGGKTLYVGDGKYLVEAKDDLSGSYSVASGTLLIANNAFDGCSQLTAVVINADLLYIGEHAFANCGSMTSLTFTNKDYTWFATGAIGRVTKVEVDMWYSYVHNYPLAWRRYMPVQA